MDNIEYKKTEDGQLEVVFTIPQEIIPEKVEKVSHNVESLKQSKVILEQEIAKKQSELDEVNNLLKEADKLGITESAGVVLEPNIE